MSPKSFTNEADDLLARACPNVEAELFINHHMAKAKALGMTWFDGTALRHTAAGMERRRGNQSRGGSLLGCRSERHLTTATAPSRPELRRERVEGSGVTVASGPTID